jgi:hypothetical protein
MVVLVSEGRRWQWLIAITGSLDAAIGKVAYVNLRSRRALQGEQKLVTCGKTSPEYAGRPCLQGKKGLADMWFSLFITQENVGRGKCQREMG